MTGVLIKSGNLDTDTCRERRQHEATQGKDDHLSQRERPGPDPSLIASEGTELADNSFGLLASKTVRL